MSIEKIIKKINDLGYVVKADQWEDEWRHWRVGLNWFGTDEYFFLCEELTLKKGLLSCLEYAEKSLEEAE